VQLIVAGAGNKTHGSFINGIGGGIGSNAHQFILSNLGFGLRKLGPPKSWGSGYRSGLNILRALTGSFRLAQSSVVVFLTLHGGAFTGAVLLRKTSSDQVTTVF
jgi:hypothetical protein